MGSTSEIIRPIFKELEKNWFVKQLKNHVSGALKN